MLHRAASLFLAFVVSGCLGNGGPETLPADWQSAPVLVIVDGEPKDGYEEFYLATSPGMKVDAPSSCRVYINGSKTDEVGCRVLNRSRTAGDVTYPWTLFVRIEAEAYDYWTFVVVAFDEDWNVIATHGSRPHDPH